MIRRPCGRPARRFRVAARRVTALWLSAVTQPRDRADGAPSAARVTWLRRGGCWAEQGRAAGGGVEHFRLVLLRLYPFLRPG